MLSSRGEESLSLSELVDCFQRLHISCTVSCLWIFYGLNHLYSIIDISARFGVAACVVYFRGRCRDFVCTFVWWFCVVCVAFVAPDRFGLWSCFAHLAVWTLAFGAAFVDLRELRMGPWEQWTNQFNESPCPSTSPSSTFHPIRA